MGVLLCISINRSPVTVKVEVGCRPVKSPNHQIGGAICRRQGDTELEWVRRLVNEARKRQASEGGVLSLMQLFSLGSFCVAGQRLIASARPSQAALKHPCSRSASPRPFLKSRSTSHLKGRRDPSPELKLSYGTQVRAGYTRVTLSLRQLAHLLAILASRSSPIRGEGSCSPTRPCLWHREKDGERGEIQEKERHVCISRCSPKTSSMPIFEWRWSVWFPNPPLRSEERRSGGRFVAFLLSFLPSTSSLTHGTGSHGARSVDVPV